MMTEDQKIEAIQKAARDYRSRMAVLEKTFDSKITAILANSRQERLKELKKRMNAR
jgi:hypothetical protein